MVGTKKNASKYETYSALKDFSTSDEKDRLIMDIVNDNPDFEDKEIQINQAFGEWLKIQSEKFSFTVPVPVSVQLARGIKNINKNEITVGIRDISDNKLEYWIICKNKDYDILDRVYDIYQSYIGTLKKSVDFIFVSESQLVGEKNIVFSDKF